MADCRQIAPLLAAYAFDALGEEERELVHAHLEACPACARQLELYRPLPGFLDLIGAGETEIVSPPPLLEASVAAGIPAPRRRALRARGPLRRLAPALGAGVLAGIAVGAAVVALVFRARPAPAALRVTLASSGLQPHAAATAALREHPWGTEVDLVARLAPTREDAVYEVWFVGARGRLSAGTFTVPVGRRQVSVRLACAAHLEGRSGAARYRYLGITLQTGALGHAAPGPNVLRARLPV
jgi:hypothetical protein